MNGELGVAVRPSQRQCSLQLCPGRPGSPPVPFLGVRACVLEEDCTYLCRWTIHQPCEICRGPGGALRLIGQGSQLCKKGCCVLLSKNHMGPKSRRRDAGVASPFTGEDPCLSSPLCRKAHLERARRICTQIKQQLSWKGQV